MAFGGALIVTLLIQLLIMRGGAYPKKVVVISSVFIASIIAGNVSQNVFHWGEYPSAIVAAFVGPVALSKLHNFIQRNLAASVSMIVGLFGGLGTGAFIANFGGMKIIGKDWFGILCGSGIVLGFGIGFGFMLGPRIGELLIKVFRVKPIIGAYVSVGFILGIIIAMVLVGLANGQDARNYSTSLLEATRC